MFLHRPVYTLVTQPILIWIWLTLWMVHWLGRIMAQMSPRHWRKDSILHLVFRKMVSIPEPIIQHGNTYCFNIVLDLNKIRMYAMNICPAQGPCTRLYNIDLVVIAVCVCVCACLVWVAIFENVYIRMCKELLLLLLYCYRTIWFNEVQVSGLNKHSVLSYRTHDRT